MKFIEKIIRVIVRTVIRIFFVVVYRVKVIGTDNIPKDKKQPLIYCGESIALFPEGTRNGIEKGEKAKDGAAFFAVRTGAKVIPVGIKGGEKPFKKMTIKYGKPMDFSNRSKDELDEITDEIMKEIIELSK